MARLGRGLILLALLASGALSASDPPLDLRGDWRQGSVIVGRAQPGSTASFNGRALRVSADGRIVIGLDRDEGPSAELTVAKSGVELSLGKPAPRERSTT